LLKYSPVQELRYKLVPGDEVFGKTFFGAILEGKMASEEGLWNGKRASNSQWEFN
jgi:hypothetical protein